MSTRSVTGTYGRSKTENTVYIYEDRRTGLTWYALDGSTNVNATYDSIEEGCDVEEVSDYDTFQADEPVESEGQLEDEVDDYLSN